MTNLHPPRDSAYFRKLLRAMRRSRNLWPVVNILAIWCWIFCMVGTFHCSFLMVSTTTTTTTSSTSNSSPLLSSSNDTDPTTNWNAPVGIGLFTTSVYDWDHNLLGCVSYYGSSDEFDGAFRASRAFGVMASIGTTLSMLLVSLCTLVLPANRVAVQCWTTARLGLFVSFVSELLTFLAFGRDLCGTTGVTCQPGSAAVVSILNLFLLCLTSALLYVVPPPPTPLFVLFQKHRQSTPPAPRLVDLQHGTVAQTPKETTASVRNHGNNNRNDHSQATVTSTSDDERHYHHPEATNTSTTHDILNDNYEIVSIEPSPLEEEDHLEDMILPEETITSSSNPTTTNNDDHSGTHDQGIECVESDHPSRRRTNSSTTTKQHDANSKPFLVDLVHHYFQLGQGKHVRTTMGALLVKAWILSVVGVSRCTFVLVGVYGQDRADFSGLGLFNRAYYRHDDILGCIAYPSAARSEFDAAYQVARVFGILSLLLVSVSLVAFAVLHGFVEYSLRKEQVWLALVQVTLPCALIAHLLLFTAFQTESCTHSESVKCVPGMAGIMAILNVFLLVPLAFFIFALPCPKDPLFCVRPPPPPRISHKSQTSRRQPPSPPNGSVLVCHANGSDCDEDDDDNAKLLQQRKLEALALQPMGHNGNSFDQAVRVRSFHPSVEVSEQGARTTIHEITHPDGSKSVTTTTIEGPDTTLSSSSRATSTSSSRNSNRMRLGRRLRKFTTRSQRLKQEQKERERLLQEQQQRPQSTQDSNCCIIDPSGMALLGYQGVYSDDHSDRADTVTLNSVYTNTVTGATHDDEAGGTCAARTGNSSNEDAEEVTSSAEAFTDVGQFTTSSNTDDGATFNTGGAIDNDTVVAAVCGNLRDSLREQYQQGEKSLDSDE